MSLDGSWQVIFDHDNKGRTLNWQHREQFHSYHDIEEVAVPACLEEFRQDYEGAAWYGKSFHLPADWEGKTVRVRFEAVNYRAEVWVNGEAAGAHEGGYTGFELEIGDLLHAGAESSRSYSEAAAHEHFIAVRVITPLITRDVVIDGLGRDDMPHWRGAIAGGIWQPVSLIATDAVYIENAFVTGDVGSGNVRVELALRNTSLKTRGAEVQCQIASWADGKPSASVGAEHNLRPGRSEVALELNVPGHKLWQLDDPFLYVATTSVQLADGLSDRVETRFGFREFTAEGKNFYLNGKKIVLKTTFNEAFYPHSLAYPRDLELLRKEFKLIKEGNINMVRPWRKPQPPVVYDMADEMGVLYVGALPVECMDNWPQITPYTRQRIENEVTEMVLRDRNHPSIVIWEMFNEILRDGLKRLRHTTSLKARELDPTRLIIDEAGGFAGLCSVYLPGSYEPTLINDVHDYPGTPFAQQNYDNLMLLGKTEEQLETMGRTSLGQHTRSHIEPGLLTNISELGYGSIPDLEANMAQYRREGNPITPDYRIHERLHDSYLAVYERTGLDELFPTFHDFMLACQEVHYTGNKLMAEACRINADIAGIGIHSLNDGDWIVGAGLIDNFRNPKRAYYAIQETFADRYIAIRPSAQNVYAGQGVQILLTSVNDEEAAAGTLSLQVTASDGQRLLDHSEETTLPAGIVDLGEYAVATDGLTGRCLVEVAFHSGADTVTSNDSSFYVLTQEGSALPGHDVALIDLDGALGAYLAGSDLRSTPFSADTPRSRRVLVNLNGWGGEEQPIFADLERWVSRGGTAVFLGMPPEDALGTKFRMQKFLSKDILLPFALTYYSGKGLWTPCSHVVRKHPVYDGLPSACLMGQEYRDVVSRWSIVTPETDWISGNVTYDWYAGLKHKQNYIGVTAAFHGADLTQIAHGEGSYILCTHRLVENLGKDPVAERLFSNLVGWALR
jgi:hypothetical protein